MAFNSGNPGVPIQEFSVERVFTMDLTPRGVQSKVLMDGEDISKSLRGVAVRSSVDGATSVELLPANGCRAELIARLPEARVSIAQEPRQLHVAIIAWFESKYGYNSDPSQIPDGDILRWALTRRQGIA